MKKLYVRITPGCLKMLSRAIETSVSGGCIAILSVSFENFGLENLDLDASDPGLKLGSSKDFAKKQRKPVILVEKMKLWPISISRYEKTLC